MMIRLKISEAKAILKKNKTTVNINFKSFETADGGTQIFRNITLP